MKKNRHIALLRGINVGGKNKLPMKTLLRLFEGAGAENCRHYIQSGNVVFDASPAVMKGLTEAVRAAIHDELGLTVPLVMRSAEDYARNLPRNPFLAEGCEKDSLFVAFLATKPKANLVKNLDPDRSAPDRFQVIGSEVFMTLPNGAARSKLTAPWLDSKLQTTSTFRNWRTCMKLLQMIAED